jgi:ADP-ribose pyrophosphatase YjhB (NUDIX family)
VLDERDRVLLFRYRDPRQDHDDVGTPGGGLLGDETYEDAARREMAEELLVDDLELGPALWHRTCEFDFLGTWTRVEERFFLVRIEAARLPTYPGHLAIENVLSWDWWTLEEIDASDEAIWPSELGSLVRSLLAGGPPAEPIPIGA